MINLDRIEKKCIAPGAPNCLSGANLISIVMTFIRREKKCPKKVQDDARWTEGPHRALEYGVQRTISYFTLNIACVSFQ